MPSVRSLITGGAGFIGSHLARTLLERGEEVLVVDDLSTGREANLPRDARLRFVHATVSDALPGLATERIDRVYHLAASVGVKRVLADPVRAIETNVHETSELLRFVSDRGLPTLVASSSEVYGKAAGSPFREEDDCHYGPTTSRRWCYACSKALDEHLALAHHERHDLPVVVTRFFNIVGPRQVGEYGMVLPTFISQALDGRPLTVFGTGRQSRCFCDVRDVAPALPRLLESPACLGGVFNVGSDQPISMEDLARRVLDVLGLDGELSFVAYDRAYGPGFEDLSQRQPSLDRVRGAIGFEPKIPLEQTIRDIASELEGAASRAAETGTQST